jgi:hypothetical protein
MSSSNNTVSKKDMEIINQRDTEISRVKGDVAQESRDTENKRRRDEEAAKEQKAKEFEELSRRTGQAAQERRGQGGFF